MRMFLLSLLVVLSGCTALGITEQKTLDLDKSDAGSNELEIASFPAQLRGAYVYTGSDGKKYVCAEPFTDVAASSSLNATANAVNNLSTALNQSLNASRNANGSSNGDSGQTTSSESEGGSQSSSANQSSANTGSYQNTVGSSYGTTAQTEQSINVGLNTVNEIVALEGRTQFVLLAREMLFRTCEAAANGNLESAESPVAKQHALVFTALTKMIETQKVKADAEKAKAEAEKAKAVVAAAEKLDPKILKVFADGSVNQTILNDYLEEYTNCVEGSGDDQGKKDACKKEYNKKVSKLAGE